MKVKSTLIIACLVLASLMIVGTTTAQAECCWGNVIAAPFVAAGAVVEGAVMLSAAVVTAPFTALSCGNCGIALSNPCSHPWITYVPHCDHC